MLEEDVRSPPTLLLFTQSLSKIGHPLIESELILIKQPRATQEARQRNTTNVRIAGMG